MRRGTHSVHRSLRIALLMVSAAVMALLLTQCQMVDDRIAAPTVRLLVQPSAPGSCISLCARTYADSVRAESQRHVQFVEDCDGLQECMDLEQSRHREAVSRLNQERKTCMDACHHQGAGTGGR